jgi:hypothetical protein
LEAIIDSDRVEISGVEAGDAKGGLEMSAVAGSEPGFAFAELSGLRLRKGGAAIEWNDG